MAIIDLKPKLRAKVGNVSLHFLDQDAFLRACAKLHGKTITVILQETPEMPVDRDLYAFYFGIIIRKECMSSEAFKTYYCEMDIHNILQYKLRTFYRMENGVPAAVTDLVLQYSEGDFKLYIQDVIMYLAVEFEILVKDYETYHIDKNRLTR